MNIKELRQIKGLTQIEAANVVGLSRRGYQDIEYENNLNSRTYQYAFNLLQEYNKIDEEHGIVSIQDIKNACFDVAKGKSIDYFILFGSYARNEASETSDIDLVVSTSIDGLAFFGLIEELSQKLHKKVDLIKSSNLIGADDLVQDILKEGIKVYETKQE